MIRFISFSMLISGLQSGAFIRPVFTGSYTAATGNTNIGSQNGLGRKSRSSEDGIATAIAAAAAAAAGEARRVADEEISLNCLACRKICSNTASIPVKHCSCMSITKQKRKASLVSQFRILLWHVDFPNRPILSSNATIP